MEHKASTFNTVSFYVLWLTLVGCFTIAVPAAGVTVLVLVAAVSLKSRR
jgi:hypothetical protein